jgi:hypothetical protein
MIEMQTNIIVKGDRPVVQVAHTQGTEEITPVEAVRLASDLLTAAALALGDTVPIGTPPVVQPARKLRAVRKSTAAEVAENVGRLTWHREGKGSSSYVTELANGTEVRTVLGRKGWDIKVGDTVINNAPIAKKADALALVDEIRPQLMQA